MRWWKWRINLLHKLTPLWGRGGRLRYRCGMCWQFEMRPGQWFGWQLRYFTWIYLNKWLLLWPLWLVISKHLINMYINMYYVIRCSKFKNSCSWRLVFYNRYIMYLKFIAILRCKNLCKELVCLDEQIFEKHELVYFEPPKFCRPSCMSIDNRHKCNFLFFQSFKPKSLRKRNKTYSIGNSFHEVMSDQGIQYWYFQRMQSFSNQCTCNMYYMQRTCVILL